jgi:hypothetical protein
MFLAERKSSRKMKGALTIAIALTCIFALTTIIFYVTSDKLQKEQNILYTNYVDYTSTHYYNNTEYDNLQSQYYNMSSEKYWLQIWLNGNKSQIDTLNTQIDNLNSMLNLEKPCIWVNHETISEPASSYITWTPSFSASYAGYVSVNVETSSSTTTYVQVTYTSHGINYDNRIVVGTSGIAYFPILPSSNIEIRIGNTNLITGHTQTVTITYYY